MYGRILCIPVIRSVPSGGEDLFQGMWCFLHRVVHPERNISRWNSELGPVNVAILYVLDLLPDLDEGIAEPR